MARRSTPSPIPLPDLCVAGPDAARWWSDERFGGWLVAAAAVLALLWASGPLRSSYVAAWHHLLPLASIGLPTATVRTWIDDGAMTVFFLVVGIDLARERNGGVLTSWRRAAAPGLAALTGMAAAAGCYLAVVGGGPGEAGWGVPMATDIALVAAAAGVLGDRVPPRLRTFLVSVAVADDVASIAVLAVVSDRGVTVGTLARAGVLAAAGVACLVLGRRWSEGSWPVLAGLVLLWLALARIGVEPALAGVVAGSMAPTAPGVRGRAPADRLHAMAHPLAMAVVVPVFALANLGVDLRPALLAPPGAAGVFAGVVLARIVGKTGGIAAGGALERVGQRQATGFDGRQLIGGSALCGAGFTVPVLFVALTLASTPALAAAARAGLLVGSVGAVLAGACVLRRPGRRRSEGRHPRWWRQPRGRLSRRPAPARPGRGGR
jgi:NhaA family Na+:H+ antiporter